MAGSRPWRSWAPAGGGLVTAPRHSTNTWPARTISGSSSGPKVPPTELTWAPGASQPSRRIGSRASVQQATTSAPATASSKLPTARAAGCRSARASARPGVREATRTSRKPRTSGNASRWERPCTPAPRMASTAASGRARAPAATAAAAPVRAAVMRVPSRTARGVPSAGSNRATSAWWEGRPRPWLPGKTLTSLAPRATPSRCTGMAPRIPPSADATTRGGTDARPALKLRRASARAASSASRSSSRVTSASLSTSTSAILASRRRRLRAATIYGMATDGRPAGAGSLRLLGANRPFRLLWSARAVSYLGDSLALVALMLHVARTTGQALAVAALLLAGDFAPALLGPLTGTVADRLDRRRVMVACELVQGVLVVVIALWLPSLPLLLVLVGLRAVAGQVFQPASRAAVPEVVPEPDLERANAAVGVATNGSETLGPLVAALLLPVLEVRGVLLVDAATFAVSAALLGFLPALPGAGPDQGPRVSFLADARTGLRYVWGERMVRAVVGGYVAIVACNGIDDVALVFLATDTLGGGDGAVGLLLAAVGIGLLAGYALLARSRRRVAMPALLLAGFAVSSAGNLLTGLAWAVAAAFAVQAIRGLGIAALDVAATTLVQRIVPARLLGRVFGTLYGGIGVAAAFAYLLGGLLLDRTTPRVAFVAAGTAGLLATGATALALRRARPPATF